jgi:hypothetical protein
MNENMLSLWMRSEFGSSLLSYLIGDWLAQLDP